MINMMCCFVFFFFFKQKTAYEMLRSLVGSEMCIRDSVCTISSNVAAVATYKSAGFKELPRVYDLSRVGASSN